MTQSSVHFKPCSLFFFFNQNCSSWLQPSAFNGTFHLKEQRNQSPSRSAYKLPPLVLKRALNLNWLQFFSSSHHCSSGTYTLASGSLAMWTAEINIKQANKPSKGCGSDNTPLLRDHGLRPSRGHGLITSVKVICFLMKTRCGLALHLVGNAAIISAFLEASFHCTVCKNADHSPVDTLPEKMMAGPTKQERGLHITQPKMI